MFFNELDMLELRLNILNDYVDQFVLVEAKVGFTGTPKPLYFEENKNKFEKFLPKIKHIIIDSAPSLEEFEWYQKNSEEPVRYEFHQRNSIVNAVANEPDDSIIFVSDLDEIWDPLKIIPFLPNMDGTKIYKPQSKICYFYFNLVASPYDWVQPIFLKHSLLKELTANGLKLTQDLIRNNFNKINLDKVVILENSGWHFSFSADVFYKMKNSGHTKLNKPPYNTKEYLDTCIKTKKNPFHGFPMYVIPQNELEEYLPDYIKENMEKYQKYILIE